MRKGQRRLLVICLVLAVIGAIALALVLRRDAAPEAARLLPDGDAVVFVHLKNIRRLTSFSSQPVVTREPGYDQFVKETGFQFERDLDEAAFAVHTGLANGQNRYSEILVGRYDSARLSAYLRKVSRAIERYRGVEIFSVPIENRTVRIALLAVDTVGVSNVDDASVIHGMIDRFKEVALPFGGPNIVREYYRHVPFGSTIWAVAHIPQAPSDPTKAHSLSLPGGIDIFVPSDSYVVASLRVLTAIHARAEFFTNSDEDARRFSEQAGTLLALFHSIESNTQMSGSDEDVKAFFGSLKVEQQKKRAIVTAEVPVGFLRKLFSEPAATIAPPPTTPPAPVQPEKKKAPKGKR